MTDSLSIIIPAYNEASCIEHSLAQVLRFAGAYPGRCEVIVVDDGSSDATPALVAGAAAKRTADDPPLLLCRHEVNRGKGASIRTGFLRAAGDIVLFTDADLSAPIDEAPRLIEPITQDRCDVVVGSRSLDPALIEVRQGLLRRASGRVFNRMVRCITGLGIRDTQCGFKAFRRERILPAVAAQRIEGFAFDVELLYLAAKLGLRILEVPVRWSHVHESKVSLLTHAPQMFWGVCGIRCRDWRGGYGRLEPTPAGSTAPDRAHNT